MRKKIFTSTLAVILTVLLLSFVIITGILFDYFKTVSTNQLKDELTLAVQGVELSGTDYLEAVSDNNYRLTWVADDGMVIFDTDSDKSAMDNHTDREEIKEAFESGVGSSSRHSDTLGEKTLYEAVLLDDGSVLRISTSQTDNWVLLLGMIQPSIVILVISLVVAFILANRVSKSIVKPLTELDLDNPTENDTYEELSPVLTKIHKQHKQIKTQMGELRQKNDEFNQIISSMNEGLVLLNEDDCVISMNTSAKGIFSVSDNPVGEDFHIIDRTPEISGALQSAKNSNHAEINLSKNGREYQLNISRIVNSGKPVGTLILMFDITEKAFAERNRQEFTANVSHELKTPLQTIIGSAELLENGLVKPDDTGRFLGNIRKEATRLVALINDIIRLSQLDEKGEPIKETVDVYAVAGEVAEVLTPSAEKKNITLSFSGESVEISGIRRYLYEIIYNLCDNAIRYTEGGGKVDVSISEKKGNAVITVSDNGIGIPPEHQSRIFERFYRVDKSHSRDTGGTGLGLSIVKRAVMLHNGKLELHSVVGEGTTIKAFLPK